VQLSLLQHCNALFGRRRIEITDDRSPRLDGAEFLGRALGREHRKLAPGTIMKCVNCAVERQCQRQRAAVRIDRVDGARMTAGVRRAKLTRGNLASTPVRRASIL
jgi:hypothetical protein